MRKSIPKILFALLLIIFVFGFLMLLFSDEHHSSRENSTATQQKNPKNLDLSKSLANLQWNDLEQTLAAGPGQDFQSNDLIYKVSAFTNSPALYLKALLQIARNQPQLALESFSRIPVNEIPPRFLYSPYRLQQASHPDEPNSYLSKMKEALKVGVLPTLIRARFYSCEGDLVKAHTAYLESNPAQWKSHDVACLARIAQHSGLQSEMKFMIQGALNVGKISESILGSLRKLLTLELPNFGVLQAKRNLKRELQSATPAGTIALKSMNQILDARQKFLQRDYETLLDSHSQSDPFLQTTETALLLFLSALNIQNSHEITRWSQELKRRHPEPEVLAWISRLHSDSLAP